MSPDDRSLIQAFQQGDEFAFVSLYNRHKEGVFIFCTKMLLDASQAEDMMQETFLRVYENKDRLLNAGAFKSWLFTIARNQCLNVLRRRHRQEPLTEQHQTAPLAPQELPSAQLEKSEQVALVNQILQELSPAYREVLILREYQNLSYEEIASITRSTLSAVKSRLFKARRKMADLMAPKMQSPPAVASPKVESPPPP
ncbi:MAG: RNA polymerase sigma factor [Bacteroidota bacterium]